VTVFNAWSSAGRSLAVSNGFQSKSPRWQAIPLVVNFVVERKRCERSGRLRVGAGASSGELEFPDSAKQIRNAGADVPRSARRRGLLSLATHYGSIACANGCRETHRGA